MSGCTDTNYCHTVCNCNCHRSDMNGQCCYCPKNSTITISDKVSTNMEDRIKKLEERVKELGETENRVYACEEFRRMHDERLRELEKSQPFRAFDAIERLEKLEEELAKLATNSDAFWLKKFKEQYEERIKKLEDSEDIFKKAISKLIKEFEKLEWISSLTQGIISQHEDRLKALEQKQNPANYNKPPTKKSGWMNIYHAHGEYSYDIYGHIYDDIESANYNAKSHRIACVKVEWGE